VRSLTHEEDAPSDAVLPPLTLHVRPVIGLTDDQLLELSSLNQDLRLERSSKGELIVMPPAGGETSARNAEITMQLRTWGKRDGTGITFDSSGGFRLPNGAVRSPDASWVERRKLETLTDEQRKGFPPLCPDFVVELRSPTDSLSVLQDKMREYVANGAKLGWLIDPEERRVYLYRPQANPQHLDHLQELSADPVLPNFTLDLRDIW
jgi:Uma2 family endonuclease